MFKNRYKFVRIYQAAVRTYPAHKSLCTANRRSIQKDLGLQVHFEFPVIQGSVHALLDFIALHFFIMEAVAIKYSGAVMVAFCIFQSQIRPIPENVNVDFIAEGLNYLYAAVAENMILLHIVKLAGGNGIHKLLQTVRQDLFAAIVQEQGETVRVVTAAEFFLLKHLVAGICNMLQKIIPLLISKQLVYKLKIGNIQKNQRIIAVLLQFCRGQLHKSRLIIKPRQLIIIGHPLHGVAASADDDINITEQ